MKKIGLFLIAAFAAVTFTSCNNNDGDYARQATFATVRSLGGITSDYYFVADNGEKFYPGDKSRVAGYLPTADQRVIVSFNMLKEAVSGYDYNIAVYGVSEVRLGSARTVETVADLTTFGTAKTSMGESYPTTRNYFNVVLGYDGTDPKKHTFTLVRCTDPAYESEQTDASYLNLELRHDKGDDTSTREYAEWVSFRLDEFAAELTGKAGIYLRVETRNNGTQYIKYDLPTKK